MNTESFRDRLLEERRKVVSELDYLREENSRSLEDEEEMPLDNHLAETATLTLDREMDYSLEENANRVLRAIDAALERIEEGTFGTCANCGRKIPEERLDALPYATLCIDCKRRLERG